MLWAECDFSASSPPNPSVSWREAHTGKRTNIQFDIRALKTSILDFYLIWFICLKHAAVKQPIYKTKWKKKKEKQTNKQNIYTLLTKCQFQKGLREALLMIFNSHVHCCIVYTPEIKNTKGIINTIKILPNKSKYSISNQVFCSHPKVMIVLMHNFVPPSKMFHNFTPQTGMHILSSTE